MSEYYLAAFLVLVVVIVCVANIAWRKPSKAMRQKYIDYIREHPEKVDFGLFLESGEAKIVDIAWANASGMVGAAVRPDALELAEVRGLLEMRKKFKACTKLKTRFIVVSPLISREVRASLDARKIEWREVPYS